MPCISEVVIVPSLLLGEQSMQGMMKIIAPLRINFVSPARPRRNDSHIIQIALCDQMDPPAEPLRQFGHRHLQLCQKSEGTEIENPVNRIEPKRVEVILLEPVESILAEKTSHLITAGSVEINGFSPGRAITTCEVRTVGAETVPLRSQMVVDNI